MSVIGGTLSELVTLCWFEVAAFGINVSKMGEPEGVEGDRF